MNSERPLKKGVCLIAGVGPGNGEALARAFAADGYSLALVARRVAPIEPLASSLPNAKVFGCDLTQKTDVEAVVKAIETQMGAIDVVIYNAGKGVWGNIEHVDVEQFEEAWRVNTLGLFMLAKRVAPAMIERGRGHIIVIGATASLRGVANTAAFAPAKAAQRALAQSLARYLWPKGVHVALIVIDGVVGGPETREMFSSKPDDFFVEPEGVADLAVGLTLQLRSAWSFEVEARPFGEHW